MDNQFLHQILGENQELSSLPQTMIEVLRVARDEHSTAGELAEVILHDPALTTKILRIVNSPYFGAGRKIGSMTQAVVTMGMRQVTALALSWSVYRMAKDWKSAVDQKRFWRHSLEVAIAARLIAEKTGYANTEESFVAGLLHDIGLLVLEKSFPEKFGRLWNLSRQEKDLCNLEQEFWGTNHARVGEFLLKQWHIPESICDTVGQHHTSFPPNSSSPEQVPSQIICLAHHVSKFSVGAQRRSDNVNLMPKETIRENLKLPSEELLVIERDLFTMTMKEAAYLEIEIGSDNDIMIEANNMLFDQYVTVESLLREIQKMQLSGIRPMSGGGPKESTRDLAQHLNNACDLIDTQIEILKASLKDDTHDSLPDQTESTLNTILTAGEAVRQTALELMHDGDPEDDADIPPSRQSALVDK